MRLSCNFVNVYTIAYRVLHTCRPTRVYARITYGHPREDPREENRAACRTSWRGSPCVSGSWQAERGSRFGHADILATILARKSASMSVSVSVSVSVPWNSSFTTVSLCYVLHATKSQCFSRAGTPSKLPLSVRESGHHLTHGPSRPHTPNRLTIVSAVFAQLALVPNAQTCDRHL